MQRRLFVQASLGMCVKAARAQPSHQPVVGYLNGASAERSSDLVAAFRSGLAEMGIQEGRNASVDWRWANERYEQLDSLASQLVDANVAVIAATSTPAALAAKRATARIPIIFTVGNDPVAVGLVKDLARPEGNVTGVTRRNLELTPKRLELLHEAVPRAKAVALLVNPANPDASSLPTRIGAVATQLQLQLSVFHAKEFADVAQAFSQMRQRGVEAVLIGADPMFNAHIADIARVTLEQKLPAMYQYRPFCAAGGLLSYGASNVDSHRRMGVYVARILQGARPSDLPVEQSEKLELFVNRRTARELGLQLPAPVLARAADVLD